MKKLSGVLFAIFAGITINAHANGAGVVWLNDTGATVAAPVVLDSEHGGVFFTETETGPFQGFYDVTNNTVDYRLVAFGVSNTDTVARILNLNATFGCFSSWCYEADNLTPANWGDVEVDFNSNTGEDLFGAINNVLDPGENTINFYRAADGELGPGDSWDGFLWAEALASSQMFAVLEGPGGTIYGSGIHPSAVPVPAAVWLFASALVALRLRRRNL